jgi:hypothetical protein
MATLLRYALTSNPFPLQASAQTGSPDVATLTLVATNATDKGVPLQGLLVTLPIGDGAAQLAASATGIGPVPPPGWKLAGTQFPKDAVQYTFQPTGDGTVGSQQSLVFTFNSVTINQQPGTCEVVVMEGSNNCQPPACPTDTLYLTKFPNGWGTVSFWADPPIVPAGSGTTLNWSGPAGATYAIEYYTQQTGLVNVPEPGQPPLANAGRYPAQGQPPLQLEQNTTFYLMVSEVIGKQTYSAQQNVPVTVESVQISASGPSGAVDVPADVVIKWTTVSATKVSIQPTGQTADATSGHGQFTVQPTSDTTYVLTASDAADNTAQASVTVYVNPPQITCFKATPGAVKLGGTSTLSWQAISSADTSIDQGVGKVAANGHVDVTPPGVTTYTLMAQSQPPLATATVTVIAAQPGFTQALVNPDYANVEAALVFKGVLWMLDFSGRKVWSSISGLHWTPVQVAKPWTKRSAGGAVVFDDGSGPRLWLMGGWNDDGGSNILNDVWCTTDNTGANWAQVAPVNGHIWPARANFGCVVFQNKIWVFGGWDDSGKFLNDVWSSPDGKTWTLETSNPGWSPRAYFSAATFILSSPATNQIWLCGGFIGNEAMTPVNEVYYTNDGVHWSKWTNGDVPWQPRVQPLLQQIGNELWLSGGANGKNGQDDTPFEDTWTIDGAQGSKWSRFWQAAPWWTEVESGVPVTSAVYNGLMWFMGSNSPFGNNAYIWYLLPED